MNIAIFSSYLPSTYIGGAEILTELVSEELVKRGHSVTIYTSGQLGRHRHHGYDIYTTPFLYPIPFRTILSPLRSVILWLSLHSNKFLQHADIIHAVDVDSISMLCFWENISKKFITTIQDYGLISSENDLIFEKKESIRYHDPNTKIIRTNGYYHVSDMHIFSLMKQKLKKYVRSLCLQRLKYAICVSHFVEEKLLQVAPHIQSFVIGNGVPDNWFSTKKNKKDIDVLYVGKFVWYKGVEIFVDSIQHCIHSNRICVSMVGGGDTTKLIQHIRKLGLQKEIHVIGEKTHNKILQFYRRAKIIVVPSLWSEPCGRAIVEGMASGCAVIATNVGGTPESLINNTHGILVPAGDTKALTKSIIQLLTNNPLRQKIETNAKQYAKKYFSIRSIAKQYESCYHLLLKK